MSEHVSGWTLFDVMVRLPGRKDPIHWQRYAPSEDAAVEGARRAAAREFGYEYRSTMAYAEAAS